MLKGVCLGPMRSVVVVVKSCGFALWRELVGACGAAPCVNVPKFAGARTGPRVWRRQVGEDACRGWVGAVRHADAAGGDGRFAYVVHLAVISSEATLNTDHESYDVQTLSTCAAGCSSRFDEALLRRKRVVCAFVSEGLRNATLGMTLPISAQAANATLCVAVTNYWQSPCRCVQLVLPLCSLLAAQMTKQKTETASAARAMTDKATMLETAQFE